MAKKISVKDKIGKKMEKKYSENVKNRGFTNYLDTSAHEKVEFFTPKKGKHCIDIIPYEVETEKHPGTKKGEYDYNIEIWVHWGVGANNGSFLCLEKMYNKKCPICEYLQHNEIPEEDFQKMKAKQRVLYNVIDHEDEKAKLFSVSYPLFEDEWQKLLEDYRDEEEIVTPIYDEGGYSIRFSDTGKKGLGRFAGFRFVQIEDYDESLLKGALSLETLLVIPTYDEVKKAFEGTSYDEEDETKKVEDEEEIEEKVEEDKPVSKKKIEKKEEPEETDTPECPNGFTFGKDFETSDECEDCGRKTWRSCKKENDKLLGEV